MNKRPHVLIVEDNERIAEFIKYALAYQPENYEISYASDGEQGIRQVHDNHPDVILLDAQMPKIDGYEVARTLRAEKNMTPIIMLTCDDNEAKGLSSGCNAYLRKPFLPKVLRTCIKSYIEPKIA